MERGGKGADMELIVLLDGAGRAVGSAQKSVAHNAATPLHLAFSCYLTNHLDQVLLTRRALSKQTFPGLWTNSFCGHPAPGESLRTAVERRARAELGCGVRSTTLVLPEFSYAASSANGTTENEWCPVVRAHIAGELKPAAAEVSQWEWLPWDECSARSRSGDASPWFREQVQLLSRHGPPSDWPAGSVEQLPPAVRW